MLFQQHSLESKLNDFHQSLKPIALQFSSNFNDLRYFLICVKFHSETYAI